MINNAEVFKKLDKITVNQEEKEISKKSVRNNDNITKSNLELNKVFT